MTKNKLLLIFFNVLLIGILSEGAIRISGIYKTYSEKNFQRFDSYYGQTLPTYYHIHPPNQALQNNQTEFNYTKVTNSLGLIEKEITSYNTVNKTRAFVIGDSFAEGVGAPQDSSMPALLQHYLEEKVPNQFEVLNAGIVGSDVFFGYHLLKDKLLPLQPEIVLLNFNYSDYTDFIFRGGFERFKKNGTVQYHQAPAIEPYYKHSHLLRAFVHFVLGYDFTLIKKTVLLQRYQNATTEIFEAIKQMNSLCKAHNIQFAVVLQPYPFSYVKDVPGYEYVDSLAVKLRQTNIQYINTYRAFDSVINKNNYLEYSWEKDGHFNSKGYSLFASIIYAEINRKYPHIWKIKSKQ